MAQLFSRGANTLARVLIVGGFGGVALVIFALTVWFRSPASTGVGRTVEQPVPFSHAHHVGALRIDCRYCHQSVETAAFAGIPDTDTCMSCHWQVWTEVEMLEPVRESWRTGERLRWRRVYNLPDFVYFDHSIHGAGGVGCVTCHGQVDQMPLLVKAQPLTMQWCLDCHRDPAPNLRPVDEVFATDWRPREDRRKLGRRPLQGRGLETGSLPECVT